MLIEKRVIILKTEDQVYLMLDGKVIDVVKDSPKELIKALERGEYQLPPDSYNSLDDVQYISLTEPLDSPEEWYNNQQFPSCGCQGKCGGCCSES